MQKKICCIFNVAPHYNEPIYMLMDEQLNCDFYLGDKIHLPIRLMDYTLLKGYKKSLKYKPLFSSFYWQKGAIELAFKRYKHIILTGEPFCLSTWFILVSSKLTGTKTYLWTHGWYGNESFIKTTIKKIFLKLPSKILLYGDYARNLMINEGFKPEKLITIYNSLDYENQLKIRKTLAKTNIFSKHFGNNYPVIIFVGRIQKVKKLEMLLDSIAILNNQNKKCNLVVVGEEVEKTFFKDKIEHLNLSSQVWLHGSCFDEEILGELFYNADICVSPGNVGLTAIHSLMYGTPVITHNHFSKQMPEFESITEGLNGSFFEENDSRDLAVKIKIWLETNANNKSEVQQNCYRVIDEKYNPNVQIEILKQLFNTKNQINF